MQSHKQIKEKLPKFLRLIAEGEQEQAEAMLKRLPDLALLSGEVTDLSGRNFKDITGFQYAVWALDFHMWTMLHKYLSNQEASEQIQGMKTASWVKEHGETASWQNLIDALDEFIRIHESKTESEEVKKEQAINQWNKNVGAAQKLLPVHVVNEYCHPERSFYPLPNFNAPLPRSRITNKGDWFEVKDKDGFGIGEGTFAFQRADLNKQQACFSSTSKSGGQNTKKGCHQLLLTRRKQRDELFLASLDIQQLMTQLNPKELIEFLNFAEQDIDKAKQILNTNTNLNLLFKDSSTESEVRTTLKNFYPSYCMHLNKQISKTKDTVVTCKATVKAPGSTACLQVLSNNMLVSASGNNINIWDMNTGKCHTTLSGHKSAVYCIQELPNNRLASGSYNGRIKIWDLATSTCQATLDGYKDSISFLRLLPNNLLLGATNHDIKIWDLNTNICHTTFFSNAIECLQVLPNNMLALGTHTITVLDIMNQNLIAVLEEYPFRKAACFKVLPNNKLVSGNYYGRIKIWDIDTKKCQSTLYGDAKDINCLEVLPHNMLASSSKDDTITIWDIKTRGQTTFVAHEGCEVKHLHILPNNLLLSASDKEIKLWNLPTFKLRNQLNALEQKVEACKIM